MPLVLRSRFNIFIASYKHYVFGITLAIAFTILVPSVKAEVQLPDSLRGNTPLTCGELSSPGTYTLSENISGVTGTCFTVSSDGVTIDGAGFSVTSSSTVPVAIDARRYDSIGGSLTNGADGYSSLIVNNITFSGFTVGVNASGNADTNGSGLNSGYGGAGGDVAIFYSNLGSVISNGGDTTSKGYGGKGGTITYNDTNLDISNRNISILGGMGTIGREVSGGLSLTYTGTLTTINVTLSALSYLTINGSVSYSPYPGGTWPILPGTISSCGTLLGPGTFTLTADIGSVSNPITGSCFAILSDNVTINGNGHTITSTSTNTSYALLTGSYIIVTLASTTVAGYTNLISGSSTVTLSGNNIDISNMNINAATLTISYTGAFTFTGATMSALTNFTVNGFSYGAQSAGTFATAMSAFVARDSSRNWNSVASSADGTKLGAVVNGGQIYTSTDSGTTWIPRDSSRNWYSVASSADGSKLVAVVNNGQIYTSTNFGVTWTVRDSSRQWYSVASSADGAKLVAVIGGYGPIYTSTDSGVTWTSRASSRNWQSVTSSADGTKLVAVVAYGQIYTSTL